MEDPMGAGPKARRKRNNKRRSEVTKAALSGEPATTSSQRTQDSKPAHPAHNNNPAPTDRARQHSLPSSKKRRREDEVGGAQNSSPNHPFPTEYGDHFETPLQAYQDVEGALGLVAKLLGKKKKHLRIWDPYYCAGRTPRLLAKLGFPKVEHRNEDFYQLIREKRQPVHDVLVTNPPYSGDHKKLCLEYCRRSGKPWFLLIPNYVATKDYYRLATLGSAAGLGGEPFYLVPETKYAFDHPEGTGHTDSPFSGVWYVHCGIHTQTVFEGIRALKRARISVVRSLEDLGRVGAVKTQRRLNPRQRKAISKKRSAAAAEMA